MSTTGPTDASLMVQLAQGQTKVLDLLIERHYAPLLGYLARLLGDRAAAEDLTQETFLRILRRSATYRSERPFRPWMYAIATNLVRDSFRLAESRFVSDQELDDWIPAEAEDVETTLSHRDEAERVRRALAQLSLGFRSVVILRFYAGLTVPDIAEALTLPQGTVKSRLHAATRRLEETLRSIIEEVVSC